MKGIACYEFYEQILDMWYSINNNEPVMITDILNESIWLNERILIGNRPIHNKTWIKAGIICIRDLFLDNSFMSQRQLEDTYKVSCDFLFYNGLRSAIPHRWLDVIATTCNIGSADIGQQNLKVKLQNKFVELKQATCSQFYWAEIEKISQRPTSYYKWESEFYFATFDWEQINPIPYECTSETYPQSLQYKIVHRFFPCKYNLHLWNMEDNNKCNYCNQVDTLGHFFAECVSVNSFWKSLKAWFLRTFEFCINFTPLDILLGIPNYETSIDINTLNFVILFGKFYIYSCKKCVMPIDFYNFLVKLKTRMVVEQYRCKIYNKMEEFQNKWAFLADSL